MNLARLTGFAVAAILLIGATKPAPRNWNLAVALLPSGSHLLGNPEAGVKLVEFVSYTCPHCSHFEIQAYAPMQGTLTLNADGSFTYVHNGKLSIELRNLVRDPIDLTAAILTNCGPKEKFFLNHAAMMRSQPVWIQPLVKPTPAQEARWSTGDRVTRSRAIANDFKFYAIMATRGYDRTAVDACIADQAMAERLGKMTTDAAELGVTKTPSFLLNDLLLFGTHDWEMLRPQIEARM